MKRYKLTIEYDGSPYSGWQKQDHATSVQQTIEEAVHEYCQEKTGVYGSGRTDAGVHARGQVAHVDLTVDRSVFSIRQGLNYHLEGHPISILDVEEVPKDFEARFSAKKRHYFYRIIERPSKLAIDQFRAWHVFEELDLEAMREAAKHLIGNHDFTSFRAAECQSKSPVKTLDRLDIFRHPEHYEYVHFYVSAQSFLHNQVRIMVGTLKQVGEGKLRPDEIPSIFETRDRKVAGPTAPACGLYLTKVDY